MSWNASVEEVAHVPSPISPRAESSYEESDEEFAKDTSDWAFGDYGSEGSINVMTEALLDAETDGLKSKDRLFCCLCHYPRDGYEAYVVPQLSRYSSHWRAMSQLATELHVLEARSDCAENLLWLCPNHGKNFHRKWWTFALPTDLLKKMISHEELDWKKRLEAAKRGELDKGRSLFLNFVDADQGGRVLFVVTNPFKLQAFRMEDTLQEVSLTGKYSDPGQNPPNWLTRANLYPLFVRSAITFYNQGEVKGLLLNWKNTVRAEWQEARELTLMLDRLYLNHQAEELHRVSYQVHLTSSELAHGDINCKDEGMEPLRLRGGR
ncbi:hypothetical protein FRB90_009486 [Tulasnella sp. 427]|nr:hypothetical protein FRB90_009486 [Tulasnella sp. 427]